MPKLLHAPVGITPVAGAEGDERDREGGKEREKERRRESVVGKISFSPSKRFPSVPFRGMRERMGEAGGMAEGNCRREKRSS